MRFTSLALAFGITAGTLLAAPAAHADEQIKETARLLRIYGNSLNYQKMQGGWMGSYDTWRKTVLNADSVGDLKKALSHLGAQFGHHAAEASWSPIRNAWIDAVNGAKTPADVAHAILVIEASTKWSAQKRDWAAVRDEWVTRAKAVSGDK